MSLYITITSSRKLQRLPQNALINHSVVNALFIGMTRRTVLNWTAPDDAGTNYSFADVLFDLISWHHLMFFFFCSSLIIKYVKPFVEDICWNKVVQQPFCTPMSFSSRCFPVHVLDSIMTIYDLEWIFASTNHQLIYSSNRIFEVYVKLSLMYVLLKKTILNSFKTCLKKFNWALSILETFHFRFAASCLPTEFDGIY